MVPDLLFYIYELRSTVEGTFENRMLLQLAIRREYIYPLGKAFQIIL